MKITLTEVRISVFCTTHCAISSFGRDVHEPCNIVWHLSRTRTPTCSLDFVIHGTAAQFQNASLFGIHRSEPFPLSLPSFLPAWNTATVQHTSSLQGINLDLFTDVESEALKFVVPRIHHILGSMVSCTACSPVDRVLS